MREIGFLGGVATFICFFSASQASDFLVWDIDLNLNSGPVIYSTLIGAGYDGEYTTNINPYVASLPNYRAIFICTGTVPNNGYLILYPEAIDSLISYLNNFPETNIYMEGGDVWVFDPITDLHPYFNIEGVANGSGDTDTILGQSGTFTQGMCFNYGGENLYMDRIAPLETAYYIFANESPSYINGIAYNNGVSSYRTIGTSFEFGGLVDNAPPNTKSALADSIMHFFRIWHFAYDVGVLSIESPPRELLPNEPLFPQVTVMNWGMNPASNFQVNCQIDSAGTNVYSDTRTVSNLLPDGTVGVSFDQWTPDGYGNCYRVTTFISYASDNNSSNDTLSRSACVFGFGDSLDSATYPALGPEALAGITFCTKDARFYFVNKNDKWVYWLSIKDWTIGQAFQTPNPGIETPWGIDWDGKYFWLSGIGPNYSYDRQLTYSGLETGYSVELLGVMGCDWAAGMDFDRKFTRQVSFGGTGGIYRLDLLDPLDPVLDSIEGGWNTSTERACSYIPYTHEILTGGLNSGILYKINADDGSILDQVGMPYLADLDILDMGINGVDTLHAFVTLEDAENTILKIALELRHTLNDFATVSIDSPSSDTIYSSTQLEATIGNWGLNPQSGVWVRCSVTEKDSLQPDWLDSVQVSLSPRKELRVIFGSWLPQRSRAYYEVKVETHLQGDEVPYNDDLTKTVCSMIPIHDGGVQFIFTPPDTVYCDSTYIPISAVKNFGDWSESFDVTCVIDSFADTVRVNNLPPNGSTPIAFRPWTAPSLDRSLSQMIVSTLLLSDQNSSNDILSRSIFTWCATHDGGVESILSPPDSINLGVTYSISAMIRNYGTVREDSFEVICRIDTWEDSTWVYRLAPISSVQVIFSDSFTFVGSGPWVVTLYTLVPGDGNSGNDTLSKTIFLTGEEEDSDFRFPISDLRLEQNQPNPFHHSTLIRYFIPGIRGSGDQAISGNMNVPVILTVYDITGRLVETLVNESKESGVYGVQWDAKGLSSGIYFYRLTVGTIHAASGESAKWRELPIQTVTRKMTLLR